ncbi:MAG: sigma-54 dependent transcriptional regulator [Polyangiales bacterium]
MSSTASHRDMALLYVDDEPMNLELFRLNFSDDFKVLTANGGKEALAVLEREDVGLLLSDERMPDLSGAELLARVSERWPDVMRVIVSAYSDSARLLRAMNLGHAHEYVLKPWDRDELAGCIDRALAMAARRRQLQRRASMADALAEDLRAPAAPDGIVGSSPSFRAVLASARRAAASDATVLLRGETGTGKELVARLVHESSGRASGPFIRVNCASLAEGVLQSELFGHEQGAFTGAVKTRRGRFELAHGGTIFLDEIGDIPALTQVSLLRVLQEREVERVGGSRPVSVDVRVVAATHRDLEKMVAEGQFRADLFYRLNVVPLRLPPLRERPDDVPALVESFVARHAKRAGRDTPRVTADAMEALSRYSWPGNVRELENAVERALVLSQGPELTLEDFSFDLGARFVDSAREQAQQSEASELRALLLAHGGNVARAARELNIARTTLISRAKKHGLL